MKHSPQNWNKSTFVILLKKLYAQILPFLPSNHKPHGCTSNSKIQCFINRKIAVQAILFTANNWYLPETLPTKLKEEEEEEEEKKSQIRKISRMHLHWKNSMLY